jgi:hypothetical protein
MPDHLRAEFAVAITCCRGVDLTDTQACRVLRRNVSDSTGSLASTRRRNPLDRNPLDRNR